MKNQKGFSAVVILLSLVLIGIIGGTGFYVYDTNKKSDQKTDAVVTIKDTDQSKPSEVKKAETNQGYLVIKEWGVKINSVTVRN